MGSGVSVSASSNAEDPALPTAVSQERERAGHDINRRDLRNGTPGSLGMGLAAISDWSTEYPFLDFAKQARTWIAQRDGRDWGEGGVLALDDHGWVRSLELGQRADLIFLTVAKGSLPYHEFIITYKGKGTVGYRLAARKLVGQSGPNHDVIEVSDNRDGYAVLSIEKTDPRDPIREISIVPLDHFKEFQGGAVFNPDWLKRMAPFRAVRFMDWTKTNNSAQQRWEDRPRPQDASWAVRGVPWEVTIDLANQLGADPWLNIPHLADQEYIRELAKLVHARLDPHLHLYLEHSNEVWNWQFAQAQDANAAGRARWGDVGDAFMQWHGMRTAEICDIWKREVFADDPSRVHCVLGVQAGWRGLEQAAMNCPKWASEGNEPCYRHGIDSLAIAGYFSGCLNGGSSGDRVAEIRNWLSDADGGLKKAFEQLLGGQHFRCSATITAMAETYSYFNEVAENHGMSMVAYEGGQHVTGNGSKVQDDPDFIALHIAMNRDPRMREAYHKNLEAWKKAGGTLFMHYHDLSKPSKWGSWGALESLEQVNSPKWQALLEFGLAHKCWWPGCDRAP